ncbi:hypothetical protein [Oceanirhabdus sp. W0125-5]|uniref:hypothetical protein n=1 Tax=Oceanirhabdus sp. W0125-5 TaxID=2999116 RepID=UPI0022F2E1A8|nr:hypothetical protein [Oceanirhabdus sp. W0125-5]WBW97695.1 hypothetical protein OW730_02640 [Oceanirhabdus sp. W0125-5]
MSFVIVILLFIIPVILKKYLGVLQLIFALCFLIRMLIPEVDGSNAKYIFEIFRSYMIPFWILGSLYAMNSRIKELK